MVLVLLGTNPFTFKRLILAVDEWAKESEERVIIQLGNSTCIPDYAEYFEFKPHDEILKLIRAAEFVITQGGYGSIYDCLVERKVTIVIPRKKELNEATDSGLGQIELVEYLESKNRILALYDLKNLKTKIQEAKTFVPNFEFKNNLTIHLNSILEQESNTFKDEKYSKIGL